MKRIGRNRRRDLSNGRKADSIIRLFDYSTISRSGFTLVEMLIVVAILAVLMTIVFRLGSLGGSDNKRTQTVVKLQKIENCLSGYYAAFGSYPPVKPHGWSNISQPVDRNGDQQETGSGSMNQGEGGTSLVWAQVNAACRVQPFGCEYPPSTSTADGRSEEEIIKEWSQEIKSRIGNSSEYPLYQSWGFKDAFSGGDIVGPNPNSGFSNPKIWNSSSWKVVKLFKFGVMSFLLPRYLFMMGGNGDFFGVGNQNACAQWGDNNDMPADPFDGMKFDDDNKKKDNDGWETVISLSQMNLSYDKRNPNQLAQVANIPSQAVCARWMPNLEKLCSSIKTLKFFGINVTESAGLSPGYEGSDGEIHPPDPCTHEIGGTTYRNASVTVRDGWGNEFYYYSPPPFQSYTLWSAGPNGYTFPPWVAIDSLEKDADRRTAMEWRNDDIMQMSH